ncbi:MAG: family 10 glycosylhydrolase [Bacteroidetes bacterium]|nr:family 10 glycosylhydrolase [Bacteroidota bacterium]
MRQSILWFLVVLVAMACAPVTEKQPAAQEEKFVLGYSEPVRGVWLTNVASDALYTPENVRQAVQKCHELGLNTIFVVTWNKAMTMYRSQVMKELTGYEIDPQLDPEGIGRDPLQEVIDEARKYGIKVIAWFEFGFSSSYGENGGILLQKKPHWASLDAQGRLTTKNGFEWMNALDPEVQDFMLSLVLEVVKNYEVDGIQGDDRLPAMPSEGGYNPAVIEAYKADNFGQEPPAYHKDFNWVQWRAEILNRFAERLYKEVKAIRPECIVSMSPSIFPWSKEEYLQDWPTWVNFGWVDMVVPQVYRKDSAFYTRTLEATYNYILPEKRHLLVPGVLIRVGDWQPSEAYFRYMIQENRRMGLNGEVFFFYEGLHRYEDDLKAIYKP